MKELTEKFSREFWSPAATKLITEALQEIDCEECKAGPVLRKPKHIRWQHILAYGCVSSFCRNFDCSRVVIAASSSTFK